MPDGYNKAHLQEFGEVLQAWMISQILAVANGLDQLVCDGKTLRGSAIKTDDGNHRYGVRPTASVSPRSDVRYGHRLCPDSWHSPG